MSAKLAQFEQLLKPQNTESDSKPNRKAAFIKENELLKERIATLEQ